MNSQIDLPSFLIGSYFGLMAVMAIYNLLLYFSLKDRAYLLYVGTTVFSLLVIFCTNGLGEQFVWTDKEGLDKVLYITFAGISIFFSSRFAAVFLQLDKNHKVLNKLMWVIAILSLLLSLLSITASENIVVPFGRWLVLLSFPTYIIVAFIALKKGFKPAKFYIIAWIPYVIGLVTRTMHGAGWLPGNQLVMSSLELGGALEIVLLSFALAYRIKNLQEENEQIRNQLKNYISQILSLEEKIQSSIDNDTNLPEQKIANIAKKHNLTERESDILLQIVSGLKNQQIADKLFISVNTIKFHTRNIYEKLDVKRRAEITSKVLLGD